MNKTSTVNGTMTSTDSRGYVRTLELDRTGINGSGQKVWLIFTDSPEGRVNHVERFTSRSEAINWMRWA
jgi:hypothetical protein